MHDFILIGENYEITKKTAKALGKIDPGEGLKGKIIEVELDPFVKGKDITGIKLESGIALHTLRINVGNIMEIGERDIVIHMAKESLRAFELTPLLLPTVKKPGLIIKFREDVGVEYYPNEKYEEYKLDLVALEKGISGITAESIGKLATELKYSSIDLVFPSWYYEDWVQIHFRNRKLLLRMDPYSLYGIGVGKVSKSTIYPLYKEDTIFYWKLWNSCMKNYYANQGGGTCPYEEFGKAKVKVKEKE